MSNPAAPNKPSSGRVRVFLRRYARQRRARALEQRVAELQAQLAAARAHQTAGFSQRLDTLLAISSALLITHEVDAILQLVVHQALALFPGASNALLFLNDAAGQALELRAVSEGSLGQLRISAGQAVSGRAFLSPRAMLLVGPELEIALDELDAEQQAEYMRLIAPWPPLSALVAPLRIEGRRLGSLAIYAGTDAHLFLPRDLPFVQALADLAAVAIAETHERERAALLQSELQQTETRHAETQARLDATQAQLLQSAKLAAVGELSASVAHESNNPLYAARNSLFLLEQDLPSGTPQREFLDIAQAELARIAGIITRMRDFYRPSRAELEPTHINDVLRSTIELVQTYLRHEHVTVQANLSSYLPLIEAHPDQMRQVFLNLMLNACDAMPGGGTLSVTTRFVSSKDGHAGMIETRVIDTGHGIATEHLAHLFEPFYTTKPQGTGLGLAISAHIINQHGGCIAVDSAVGAGTTFTIVLPAQPPA